MRKEISYGIVPQQKKLSSSYNLFAANSTILFSHIMSFRESNRLGTGTPWRVWCFQVQLRILCGVECAEVVVIAPNPNHPTHPQPAASRWSRKVCRLLFPAQPIERYERTACWLNTNTYWASEIPNISPMALAVAWLYAWCLLWRKLLLAQLISGMPMMTSLTICSYRLPH
jgi:hypothetical protein